MPDVKDNPEHLSLVEAWLRSYRPDELFDDEGQPAADILASCPTGARRMGCNPHALGGGRRVPLDLRPLERYAAAGENPRGRETVSSVEAAGDYLAGVINHNPENFRIFSPDELLSNKLGEVFEAPTSRNFQWPLEGGDHTEHIGPRGGRVLEILSEHMCEGWLEGYLLTGRHGMFPSYEAFLNIVVSMMDQFAKFLKLSSEFSWRRPISSLTYLETSTLWRQEHNGFSHQNPGMINALLNKKKDVMRIYLPPDANCLLTTLDHCLSGVDHVNLVIANKQPMPVWLSLPEAIAHSRAGAGIWGWASTDEGVDPDVVLVGIVLVHRDGGVLLADLVILHVEVVDILLLGVAAQVGVEIGQEVAVARPVARRLQDLGALALVIAFLIIAVVVRPSYTAHARLLHLLDRRTAGRRLKFPRAAAGRGGPAPSPPPARARAATRR